MKLYRQADCPITLTSASPTFIQVMHYLLPLSGWEIVSYSGSELIVENSEGIRAKIIDSTNKAYLTGYRSEFDGKGFPSPTMYKLDGHNGVMGSRETITANSWYLFADSTSFYFVNNAVDTGELFGISYFEPLFDDNENYFVVGNSGLHSNQSVLVSPNQNSTMLFVEGDGTGLEFGRRAGLSMYYRIDDYDFSQINNTVFLTASPIVLHSPDTQRIRGFLPNLFAFNSTFSHPGLVYTQGGFDLYCIVIDNRCFGVKIND